MFKHRKPAVPLTPEQIAEARVALKARIEANSPAAKTFRPAATPPGVSGAPLAPVVPSLAAEIADADPVLSRRYLAARRVGFIDPALVDVPDYRKPAVLDDALAVFERRMSADGTGCAYCGSALSRVARGPHSLSDNPAPSWTTVNAGRTACGWCASVIRESSEEHLAALVYAAAAGLRGVNGTTRLVVFAHAIGAEPGEPWAYLRPFSDLVADAVAHAPHRADFAAVPVSKVPGVPAPDGPPPATAFPATQMRDFWGPKAMGLEEDAARKEGREICASLKQFYEDNAESIAAEAMRSRAISTDVALANKAAATAAGNRRRAAEASRLELASKGKFLADPKITGGR